MARHAQVLAPGGLLILEVPNFHGVNLALLRRTRSPLLPVHNLNVMYPEVLCGLAEGQGLETVEFGYFGGYETQFFDVSGRSLAWRAPMSLAARLRRWRVLDHLNAPWLSGYLYGVFRKPVAPPPPKR